MKRFTELKQYLEKELHAKRFLQEGLDVMTMLETSADEHASILKQIAAARKDLEQVLDDKEKATKNLGLINERLGEKSAECDTVLDKAKADAKRLIQEAQDEAKQIMADTNEALADVYTTIANSKEELVSIKTEIDDLLKTKENINKDLEKLRKKFAGE